MKELTPAQYDSVRSLFASLAHYLTPDSIFAGLTPGRVFADEADAPQTAVAWYGHRAFVVGRADAQARQQMAGWWQSVVLYEKAQSDLEGTEEMVSERPSIGDFLAKSFGVYLLHQDEIIGWCLSEYNCGRRCEIGIAVAEPFRRRGLVTL